MRLADGRKPKWDTYVMRNTDPYGKCVVDFARAWATSMEARMLDGAALEDIAEACEREVDARPGFQITGFMYGAAVQTLAECWFYGEQLRLWHNLKTQIGNEGERANAKGTVLNPALLNVSLGPQGIAAAGRKHEP